jgi:hypothetical protein
MGAFILSAILGTIAFLLLEKGNGLNLADLDLLGRSFFFGVELFCFARCLPLW